MVKFPENDLDELYKLHKKLYNTIENEYDNTFENELDNELDNYSDTDNYNYRDIWNIWIYHILYIGHSSLLNINLIKKMLNDGIVKKDNNSFWSVVSLYQKIPLKYIKNNLDIPWNWDYISFNHNIICFNDVIKNPDLPLCMREISRNLNIKWSHVKDNLHLQWDWNNLSRNKNITIEHIISLPYKLWNWEFICCNADIKKIQWHHIKDNPKLPWKWCSLLQCDNLPLEILVNIGNMRLIKRWDHLSDNLNLTMKFIEQYLDKDWDWISLSYHKNITLDFILKHKDKDWSFSNVCYNPNITFEQIISHPELNWDWSNISSQSYITLKHIKENFQLPWDWKRVTYNKNITIEIILHDLITIHQINYSEFDWNEINTNKIITSNIIKQYPHLPWNWSFISNNQYISWELLKEFPNEYWKYSDIFSNNFNYQVRLNDFFIWKSRDRAARIIQRGCANWIDKPITADGKYGISVRIGMKTLF